MTDESKSRNSELKPCPCCGGEARFDENSDGGHYIECNGCGLTTCLVFNLMGGADRELSEVWNRRAAVSERREPSVPIADILRTADHIEKNGFSLKKFGGEMIDEGRCRELCAMYLREFVSNYHMGERLKELFPLPAERDER